MKQCGKYEELLARFIHGELLLQEKEDLESHIAVCSACERLYQGITDADRALRAIPAKLVDPPPYLRARILANLPEPKAAAPFAWGLKGWSAALGGALACALLAFALLRAQAPREERVASVPPPHEEQAAATAPSPGEAPPAAGGGAPYPGSQVAATAPALSGGGKAISVKPAPENRITAVPKVQVIREVRIYFFYPPAQKVAVTGDFNGWDPRGVPLTPAGKPGLWETHLRLPPGAYSYNFIVDGNTLVPDPNAENQMPDGYGGTNSIMLVRGDSA